MLPKRKGSILVLTMFVSAVLVLFAGIMLQQAVLNTMLIAKQAGVNKCYWIALAGISRQKHDMKEYYFQHQMEYKEAEYGGGKYKVGTATLIGQGVHKSFLVSLGQYEFDENIGAYAYKKCIYTQVGMNTASDYIYFYEGPLYDFRGNGPVIAGPVHINGDVVVGAYTGNQVFIKSEDDYGPVLEASGTIYNCNMWDPMYAYTQYTVFGEGRWKKPFKWKTDVPSNYTEAIYSQKNGTRIWPGTWYNGPEKVVPYDNEKFPSKVTRTGEDGKDYSYDLIQHRPNGGSFIKIPTTPDMTENTFKSFIDPDWDITDLEWQNEAARKISVTNESRSFPPADASTIDTAPRGFYLGRSTTKVGNLQFSGSNSDFSVSFPSTTTSQFVKYVFFTNPEVNTVNGLGWPSPVDWQRMRNGPSVTTDPTNNKLTFTYSKGTSYTDGGQAKGIEWMGHYFSQDPVGGKWYGRRIGYPTTATTGITVAPANWSFLLNSDDVQKMGVTFALPMVANEDPPHNHSEKIYVHGTLWSRAGKMSDGTQATATSLITAAGGGNVYVIDTYWGRIYFGDGTPGGGNIPGNGYVVPLVITSCWSHPFVQPISVWVHEAIPAVYLDLDKVDEGNCPRDPKYPEDESKFGVIYARVPVYVMGTPKVPVTIVCEDDVYLGPINASRLKWDLALETPSPDYEEDGEDICPVGIISKKVLYYDWTFAPQIPTPTTSSSIRILNNAFVSIDTYTQLGKWLKVNKVAVSHPLIKDVTVPFSSQLGWGTIAPRSYFVGMGRMITGGVKRGTNSSQAAAGTATGGTSFDTHMNFHGSIYQCFDRDILTVTGGENIKLNWWGEMNYVYAASFRYWKKDMPFTSGPPPHMPVDIKSEGFGGGNIAASERFFTELQAVLDRNLDYTSELSSAILELIDTMEK